MVLQDGRLFGSPIAFLNRAAPVALLAIGMTLVIATGGIDLSVGAVIGYRRSHNGYDDGRGFQLLPIILLSAWALASLAGLWNGILVSDPQNSAVCCHPDPDGRRARRGE